MDDCMDRQTGATYRRMDEWAYGLTGYGRGIVHLWPIVVCHFWCVLSRVYLISIYLSVVCHFWCALATSIYLLSIYLSALPGDCSLVGNANAEVLQTPVQAGIISSRMHAIPCEV
jgi:hypothetical protein